MLLAFLIFASSGLPAIQEPSKETAFEIQAQTGVQILVELRRNDQRIPDHYTSHILTPVCADSLCYLVEIDIQWDLLGNYLGYQVPADRPLTKFDHEPFSADDYAKLHKILGDKHSLLADNNVADLIDHQTQLVSSQVDAITGATKKSVERAIVGGAVYSTFTLWHIVNGEIRQKTLTHTKNLLNDELLKSFLNSTHYPYHYFAIDALSPDLFVSYMPEVLGLIGHNNVFIARYALGKLPPSVWEGALWQGELIGLYHRLDYKSQSLLLDKLAMVGVSSASMDTLATQLDKMSADQLEKMQLLLMNNKNEVSRHTLNQIIALAKSDNETGALRAQGMLKAIGQQAILQEHILK